jgi:hypothetical protein
MAIFYLLSANFSLRLVSLSLHPIGCLLVGRKD